MYTPSVLVTFDSMKDDNCGYFYFGKGLGNSLIANNRNRFNLSFYLHKRTSYRFENKVKIYILSKLDKLFFRHRNKFDVVHLSDQNCRLRPHKVNAVKIMTVHDMNKVHLKFSKPHRIQVYLDKLRQFISDVDKVVAISEFVADDLRHYFPEAKSKISVIYNGADKLSVPDDYSPPHIPQRPFLFTIGLLSVQKGFHLLPALLKDNSYELIIAGIETPHKQTIIEEAIKYNCLDRLHIVGPVSDLDKSWYFKNCTAFVFPSKAEGFGLPVIEAMHFGKPVFLAKKTSLPEVGGDVAYYFENFEPEHMQDVFTSGMKDFESRMPVQDIIKQAEKFSWDNAASQYLKLYEECLKLK
jgi:glycosyltransferase involved in cell wall biosynthesis